MDEVEEFWDIRNRIYRFRKVLILQCIGGLVAQIIALVFFWGETGFVGLTLFGVIIFIGGVYFLIRNGNQCIRVDQIGDRLFGNTDWRNNV